MRKPHVNLAMPDGDDWTITDCVMVRLEQMDDGHWWLAVYAPAPNGKLADRATFAIESESEITVRLTEGEVAT